MPDPAAAPQAIPATPPATPWHTGIEADILGHWQAKGWDISDPKAVATAATKAYKGVESFIGAPPDQMIRIPKDASDQAGWNALYSRLGAPNDAKEYDFSAVKRVNDQPPPQPLVDAIRDVAAQFKVPKDRAPDLLKAVVKHLDDTEAASLAAAKTALDNERAALDKSWGLNKEINRLEALKGATKLGFTPEDVNNLEKSVGYAKTMEALRRVGAVGREAEFVEGGAVNGRPPTAEAAQARKAALEKDTGWVKRYTSGDVQARDEMRQLNAQINGYDADAFRQATAA
jgi:hypothetical protein